MDVRCGFPPSALSLLVHPGDTIAKVVKVVGDRKIQF